jgi:hypothetical protein
MRLLLRVTVALLLAAPMLIAFAVFSPFSSHEAMSPLPRDRKPSPPRDRKHSDAWLVSYAGGYPDEQGGPGRGADTLRGDWFRQRP